MGRACRTLEGRADGIPENTCRRLTEAGARGFPQSMVIVFPQGVACSSQEK